MAKTILVVSENLALRASLARALKYVGNFNIKACDYKNFKRYKNYDQIVEAAPFKKQKVEDSLFLGEVNIKLVYLIENLSSTKKNLEYKIGNMSGVPTKESKYILCKEGNYLSWYSANLLKGSKEPYHKMIAQNNGLNQDNILGGGRFQIKNKVLKLWDYSRGFGGVPKKVINNFVDALKQYLQGGEYEFKKIDAKPDQYFINPKNKKIWKKLGFKMN